MDNISNMNTACKTGDYAKARALLKESRPRDQDFNDACANGQVKIVALLLEDRRAYSEVGIIRACANGHWDVVKILGHKRYVSGMLRAALENDHPHIVANLVANGYDKFSSTGYDRRDILSMMCKKKIEFGTIQAYMKSSGACLAPDDFYVACQYGHYDVFMLMLPTADPFEPENKPLRCACAGGDVRIVRKLLENEHVSTYETQHQVGHIAFKHGHYQIAWELYARQFGVNTLIAALLAIIVMQIIF